MMRKQHWAAINEFTFVTGMRILFWIYRLCGRIPFKLAMFPVVLCYLIAKPAARAASYRYLQQLNTVAPDHKIKANFSGVLRHFMVFAESLLDKMLLWGGLFKFDTVKYFGQQLILAQMAQQRGGLIICTHLGNLELCRTIAKFYPGLKITALVHTKHAQAFNQLLAQLNPESTLNLMQVTEMTPVTAMRLLEKIEQGEFVVIAGDRIPVTPNPRVAYASFLGQSAPFPVGPYILASLLQCPVYLMFSQRTRTGAELYFEPFREAIQLPRKQRDQMLTQLVADYAARLEHYCLQAPLQWFNFYDFWQLPALDVPDENH